jgi:uncharacterized phiE125 gp8 family phage protein
LREQDAEIEGFVLPSARSLLEGEYDLRFMAQTWRVYYDAFPASPFELPLSPLSSVTAIQYLSGGAWATVDAADYVVDGVRKTPRITLAADATWPTPDDATNAVRVVGVFGWATRAALPSMLRYAILLQARAIFEGKEGVSDTVRRLVAQWTGQGLDVDG